MDIFVLDHIEHRTDTYHVVHSRTAHCFWLDDVTLRTPVEFLVANPDACRLTAVVPQDVSSIISKFTS